MGDNFSGFLANRGVSLRGGSTVACTTPVHIY